MLIHVSTIESGRLRFWRMCMPPRSGLPDLLRHGFRLASLQSGGFCRLLSSGEASGRRSLRTYGSIQHRTEAHRARPEHRPFRVPASPRRGACDGRVSLSRARPSHLSASRLSARLPCPSRGTLRFAATDAGATKIPALKRRSLMNRGRRVTLQIIRLDHDADIGFGSGNRTKRHKALGAHLPVPGAPPCTNWAVILSRPDRRFRRRDDALFGERPSDQSSFSAHSPISRSICSNRFPETISSSTIAALTKPFSPFFAAGRRHAS
jgi:hypothetical protein